MRFLRIIYNFTEVKKNRFLSQKHLKIQMIVLDKLDEDSMPITENVTTNEEEFEIVRDGKYFF